MWDFTQRRDIQPGLVRKFSRSRCWQTAPALAWKPDNPSRNRTILAGLIRDADNDKATRIEMRSPNPYTNTYIAIAAFYLSCLDGIKACVESGKDLKALEKEISRRPAKRLYLDTDRQYRTEEDVFEDFTAERTQQAVR